MWKVYKIDRKGDYICVFEHSKITSSILFDLAKEHNIPVYWLNVKLITKSGPNCWYHVDVCGCLY